MKKTLLTMAAMGMAAGMWAQNVDVTPSAYKYYQDTNGDVNAILRADLRQPVAFNLGSDNWITSHTGVDGYFTDAQIAEGNILFGAFVFNQTRESAFKQAFSLYNFGGTLGKVLILNGQKSTLNEKIQENLSLEATPEIPAYQFGFGANFQYNHIMDYIAMNEYVLAVNPGLTADDLLAQAEDVEINPIRVRVRVTLNAYNNDMSKELSILNSMFVQNEAGNIIGGSDSMADGYVDVTQFSNNNVWDPTKWLVREWDMNYTGIASYIKFLGTNTDSDFDNGALLVRSVEVFVVPDEDSYPNLEGKTYSDYYDTWEEYTIGDIEETEVTDLYVIGSNVDGDSWADGTNQMTYDARREVYTWTGEVLGSSFKINNGGWNDANYNIGLSGGRIAVGATSPVIGSNDSKNILFPVVVAEVEDPVVVFDPSAMTVLVKGTPVEQEVVLYVRGNMNDWGTSSMMEEGENNIYTYTFDNVAAGDVEFKIADADWGNCNFGGGEMEVYADEPGVQVLEEGGDNIKITNWDGGTMELTFDLNTYVLTVVGPNQTSGIDSLETAEGEVEYYNLQGVKVANPQNGLYIVRKGNTTSKVIIR